MVLAQQASQAIRERTSIPIGELRRIVRESKGVIKVQTTRKDNFWCHIDDWREITRLHVYRGDPGDPEPLTEP